MSESNKPLALPLSIGLGPADAPWYCVANDGWTQRCKDEEDARWAAQYHNRVWPATGPHRAVQLFEAPRWVPVAERLPAAGCKVLVCYRNSYGRLRRTCAHYSPLHTVDASTWDEGEPDETEDGAFEPEGWWEEPVEIERVEFIADVVTHWMPMPEPPPTPDAGPNV